MSKYTEKRNREYDEIYKDKLEVLKYGLVGNFDFSSKHIIRRIGNIVWNFGDGAKESWVGQAR